MGELDVPNGTLSRIDPLQVPTYRQTFELIRGQIEPGAQVADDVELGFIHSGKLHTGMVAIRPLKDNNRVAGVERPGRSATIVFDRDLDVVVPIIYRRRVQPNDTMYVVTPAELQKIGFVALHAPVPERRPTKPLHTVVVHEKHMENPVGDVPRAAKQDLVRLLGRPGHAIRSTSRLSSPVGERLRGSWGFSPA